MYSLIFTCMTVGNNIFFIPGIASVKKSAISIFEILDEKDEDQLQVEENSEMLKTPIRGFIEFKNVSFSYLHDNNFIFNDVNFTIEEGSFVAVIGRSGSGKTSILNLIFRLYDPQQGTILIDGQNLQSLNFNFRNHVSFVSQSPYLFNGTVMENLKYGNPNCEDE